MRGRGAPFQVTPGRGGGRGGQAELQEREAAPGSGLGGGSLPIAVF
ncbi:hypothetical protein [Nonomuraea sp. NPDC049646]